MTIRLTDPAFLADPGPKLRELREQGPLTPIRMPIVGKIRATTSDAAARALLKDPRFLRQPGQHAFWWMPGFLRPMLSTLIIRDGADHRRLRHLVELAFAKSTIADLRPQIIAEADRLLDAAAPAREVDIEAVYTRPLPFNVICELMGLPADLRARAARGIAPLSHITGPLSTLAALFRLRGVFRAFAAEFDRVRATPGRGLISELVAARQDGDLLSQEECLAMVMTLFLAGHETTVHLINHAVLAMIRDPSLLAHFRDHPETRHLMIEEFLRLYSPVMITKMMTATEDLTFLGEPVRKGDRLCAFLLAANHDPAARDDPHAFCPDRRPNAHLAFGFGPHVCLGMQLARAEAEVAIDRLFARFPKAALSGPAPDWLRRPGLRARTGLRLILEP